jgi:fatty-acyl-CoA synthase
VLEAAVVGIPHEKWGEAPCAFVVRKPGAVPSEAELRQFARDEMAHFKVPAGFTNQTELPKTATGKMKNGPHRRCRRSLSGTGDFRYSTSAW